LPKFIQNSLKPIRELTKQFECKTTEDGVQVLAACQIGGPGMEWEIPNQGYRFDRQSFANTKQNATTSQRVATFIAPDDNRNPSLTSCKTAAVLPAQTTTVGMNGITTNHIFRQNAGPGRPQPCHCKIRPMGTMFNSVCLKGLGTRNGNKQKLRN
jgi:hypothetical protein